MLTISDLELTAGSRVLLEGASFQVAPGDRIGLVGRNGAGKTTLTRVLAGETLPSGGSIQRSGEIAYLPQDPRTGDLEVLSQNRILSARGLDVIMRDLADAAAKMGTADEQRREKAMARYGRAEDRFAAAGGWASEAEAAAIASSLGLP